MSWQLLAAVGSRRITHFGAEVTMLIVILILAVVITLGSAAAIRIAVSPAELRKMGVWLDRPQF